MNAGANCKSSRRVNLAIWGTPLCMEWMRACSCSRQSTIKKKKRREGIDREKACAEEGRIEVKSFQDRSPERRTTRGREGGCWDVDASRARAAGPAGMQLMDDDDAWMGGRMDAPESDGSTGRSDLSWKALIRPPPFTLLTSPLPLAAYFCFLASLVLPEPSSSVPRVFYHFETTNLTIDQSDPLAFADASIIFTSISSRRSV
jgi:hypothetical protein